MKRQYVDDDGNHFDIGFEQFKLKPGLELEMHDATTGRLLQCRVQFVLCHAGKDVLIAFQADDPAKLPLEAGKRYRVSGFSGKFDFAFSSDALKVDYAQSTVMLAAPASVAIRFVRRHRRASLTLQASVVQRGQRTPVQVTVRNLSMGGAALASVNPLGARGESVTLRLEVTFDNKKEDLCLVSVIRRLSESGESLMLETGVEFVNTSRHDKLLLHYYITTLASEFDLL